MYISGIFIVFKNAKLTKVQNRYLLAYIFEMTNLYIFNVIGLSSTSFYVFAIQTTCIFYYLEKIS